MNEEARISVLEEQIKVANNRIDDLEDKTDRIETLTLSVQELALSIKHMAEVQTNYQKKQDEIDTRLLEVEKKPDKDKAETLTRIIRYVCTAVGGAMIGFFLKTLLGI